MNPMPETFTDAEPVGHALDDEAVGSVGRRCPRIEQLKGILEQVVILDCCREMRSQRDNLG